MISSWTTWRLSFLPRKEKLIPVFYNYASVHRVVACLPVLPRDHASWTVVCVVLSTFERKFALLVLSPAWEKLEQRKEMVEKSVDGDHNFMSFYVQNCNVTNIFQQMPLHLITDTFWERCSENRNFEQTASLFRIGNNTFHIKLWWMNVMPFRERDAILQTSRAAIIFTRFHLQKLFFLELFLVPLTIKIPFSFNCSSIVVRAITIVFLYLQFENTKCIRNARTRDT